MQTVLVVDDDRGICTAIRAALERGLAQRDVRVLCAHSGLDALSTAAELSPDIAVIEGDLADVSGIRVARRLKQAIDDLKVLLVLRPDEIEELRSEVEECATEVIIRPAKLDHLVERIQMQLGELSDSLS